jgi:formylmethanofuran dehydrogenase subunit C
MPLRLTFRTPTSVPLEIDGLTPEVARGLTAAEVERCEIAHGNERRPLADFFRVSGGAADDRLEFVGNLAGVHGIGARMSGGQIHVEGNAGRHLGSEMRGGEIHVSGNAGDWVGGEMHGGLIHVRGRAGDLVGAAYRGSPRGMTGGTILVHGPVGNELGHTLRRGLIAVGGCGDFAGINLIAGTILVFGSCGERPGAGMRRGTLGLFGDHPPRLLPTFRPGSRDALLFMQLVLRELVRLDYPVPADLLTSAFRTWHGDTLALGRGEILCKETGGA